MAYCEKCGSLLKTKENGIDGWVPYCEQCGEFRYPGFQVAVSMIVLNANQSKILLIQQYGKKRNILVAGYVNKGESAEEAVRREIKEEIGLNVAQMRFNMSSYFEPSNTLMLNYAVIVEGMNPIVNEEVDYWHWYYVRDAKYQIAKGSLAERFLNHYLDYYYRRVVHLEQSGTQEKVSLEDIKENGIKAVIKSPSEQQFLLEARKFLNSRPHCHFSVVAMDIRNFKIYNEIYGWEKGNELLEYVDERLTTYYSNSADRVFGYMGGDDFCVITAHEPNENLHDEVIKVLDDENETTPFLLGFQVVYGVYLCRDYRENISFMYDCAASALETIRDNITLGYAFYDMDRHTRQVEEQKMMLQAGQALSNREFVFYLQPQVDMTDGKIIGAEALARWIHDGKMVSPGKFIPPMEKNGYISLLDQYIWEAVCSWQRSLIDRGIEWVPVSVNISRVDFYYLDVVEIFKNLIKKYDLPVHALKLEITESAYAENLDFLNEQIGELKKQGFLIYLDDFGSGYSALNVLKDMKFDVIKVDMKFMDMGKTGYTLTGLILNTAQTMEASVISEGVETESAVEELLDQGCHYAQGFYYYKPMPVEEFERLLCDRNKVSHRELEFA